MEHLPHVHVLGKQVTACPIVDEGLRQQEQQMHNGCQVNACQCQQGAAGGARGLQEGRASESRRPMSASAAAYSRAPRCSAARRASMRWRRNVRFSLRAHSTCSLHTSSCAHRDPAFQEPAVSVPLRLSSIPTRAYSTLLLAHLQVRARHAPSRVSRHGEGWVIVFTPASHLSHTQQRNSTV